MKYNDLINILISDNVYNLLKQNEKYIFDLIPELKVCKGFEQNNKWHIYDVYEHILHVVSGTDKNKLLRLTALFHDIGKPLTYTIDDNKVGHFYNHWNESINIYKKYQSKFELSKEENELIINLIFYHDVNIDKLKEEEIIKILYIIGKDNIELLFSLKRADLLAQSPDYHYLINKINNQEEKIKKLILINK